jgi:hypothetical protein
MAFDVEFAARLAERLRPYDLRWMEDCLTPELLDAHVTPPSSVAVAKPGDRGTLVHARTVRLAAAHQVVDVLQPDLQRVGGITACARSSTEGSAESAGHTGAAGRSHLCARRAGLFASPRRRLPSAPRPESRSSRGSTAARLR